MRIGIILTTLLILSLPGVAAKGMLEIDPFVCPFEDASTDAVLEYMLQEKAGLSVQEVFSIPDEGVCDMVLKPSCQDTDGGINEFERGSVSGMAYINYEWIEYEYTDMCDPCQQDLLVEYYCEDGVCESRFAQKEEIICEFGCSNGACMEEPIPEFGIGAAMIAVIGALGGFLILRKRK